MDEELYRLSQDWDAEVRRRQAELEEQLTLAEVAPDKLAEELRKVIADVNESGRDNLVRYVAMRRAVLKLIVRLISVREGPALEEDIHKLVLPVRMTGDDLRYEDHNLWLVDDTLSFYEHFASDISFKRNSAAPADSDDRPDILAFKIGDFPYQHVALVEFKRPERKDENPVDQLIRYAIQLRDGSAKDLEGSSITNVPRNVRIDAYAVVTLNEKMQARLRAGGNVRPVEAEARWYGFIEGENLHVEVLDFRAFVKRAELRNRAFFHKLGLA